MLEFMPEFMSNDSALQYAIESQSIKVLNSALTEFFLYAFHFTKPVSNTYKSCANRYNG